MPRPTGLPASRRGPLGRFVAAYGWRAYAVPLLVVLTVIASVGVVRSGPSTATSAESAPPQPAPGTQLAGSGTTAEQSAVPGPPGDGTFAPDVPSGVLPNGGPVPDVPTRTWHVVPGTGPRVGAETAQLTTYSVEVEDGMDTASFGGEESFARMVDETLSNPKSWTGELKHAFQRVDSGQPALRISLATPTTVREVCGYTIKLEVSCYTSDLDRVVLNVARWVRGAVDFQGDIGSYRQYAINHEVGHGIGYAAHQACASDGGLAPVMMQQTISTANNTIATVDPGGVVPADGFACRFNPWPFPRG
nr:DUF3152 domain-containing protein [Rhodococcus sp. X156]